LSDLDPLYKGYGEHGFGRFRVEKNLHGKRQEKEIEKELQKLESKRRVDCEVAKTQTGDASKGENEI